MAEGGRIGLKEGTDKKWIQKATKGMVKTKPCTGKKFGSKTCPPGSRRYNLAKTFKKMGRERKAADGGRIGYRAGNIVGSGKTMGGLPTPIRLSLVNKAKDRWKKNKNKE